MNKKISKLIYDADGRYLTPQECKLITDFASGFQGRFAAAREVEEHEEKIVTTAIATTRSAYPNFENFHEAGYSKCFRDMQLVLRYNVQAMVFCDVDGMNDKVLYWLRTILSGTCQTPKLISDAYTNLRAACQESLSDSTFALMDVPLSNTIEVLSDVPEPHVAAV